MRQRQVHRQKLQERGMEIWPDDQKIEAIDEHIQQTLFADDADYHDELVARTLELEAAKWGDDRAESRTVGGRKIHHLDKWDCAPAQLVLDRACEMFKRVVGSDTAHVDNSWANVYRAGDYIMPHSHRTSLASMVYFLEPGEADADDPLAGQFCFVDPRIKLCCGHKDGYVTTPAFVDTVPGLMMIFPAQIVHFVTPYTGTKPRITIAMNLSRFAGEIEADVGRADHAADPLARD